MDLVRHSFGSLPYRSMHRIEIVRRDNVLADEPYGLVVVVFAPVVVETGGRVELSQSDVL